MNKIEWKNNLFHIALAATIYLLLIVLASCAPLAINEEPTPDINATVYTIVDSLPPEPSQTPFVVTATLDEQATIAAEPGDGDFEFVGTAEVSPESDFPIPTPSYASTPASPYSECPLEVQYFEEMMWNGNVAIQKGPNSNFSEYQGHIAWVKLPTTNGGYDRKPIVLTQRCAWFVQGVLYRDSNIGFTAQLDSTGTKTVACTWWELRPNGLSTSPCYLEVKNPYQEDGLYKVYGTIAINGSFRVGVCMGADKENLVGDVACKFPGGNAPLGLLEYPYDLEVPGLSN